MRQRLADYRVFWREFRHQYHTTGAVLPSGRALARALARFARENTNSVADARNGSEGRRILEVGPGTGAVTGEILRALRPKDTLTLVERNDQFVAALQRRLTEDPSFARFCDQIAIFHSSLEELEAGTSYDLIISGLPLNNFSVETVTSIISKLRELLEPAGTLSFFEYIAIRRVKSLFSARDDRSRLRGISRVFDDLFSQHEIRKDLVLANVPPAWVHHLRFGQIVS